MSLLDKIFDDVIRPIRARGKFRLLSPMVPSSGRRDARVHGYMMRLDISDLVQRNVFLGSYENTETAWVEGVLGEGDVAIDVGANCGYYTALFAHLVGSAGKIISLEPNPSLIEELLGFLQRNSLAAVKLIRAGASDVAGVVSLYIPPSKANNEDATMVEVEGWPRVEVPVVTLSDICEQCGLDQIKLLKMDIEGHELRALKGMERHLRSGRVRYLLTELNDYWLREQGASVDELMDFCRNVGFSKLIRGSLPCRGGMSSVMLQWEQI